MESLVATDGARPRHGRQLATRDTRKGQSAATAGAAPLSFSLWLDWHIAGCGEQLGHQQQQLTAQLPL